jgi:hypothetical protein
LSCMVQIVGVWRGEITLQGALSPDWLSKGACIAKDQRVTAFWVSP